MMGKKRIACFEAQIQQISRYEQAFQPRVPRMVHAFCCVSKQFSGPQDGNSCPDASKHARSLIQCLLPAPPSTPSPLCSPSHLSQQRHVVLLPFVRVREEGVRAAREERAKLSDGRGGVGRGERSEGNGQGGEGGGYEISPREGRGKCRFDVLAAHSITRFLVLIVLHLRLYEQCTKCSLAHIKRLPFTLGAYLAFTFTSACCLDICLMRVHYYDESQEHSPPPMEASIFSSFPHFQRGAPPPLSPLPPPPSPLAASLPV